MWFLASALYGEESQTVYVLRYANDMLRLILLMIYVIPAILTKPSLHYIPRPIPTEVLKRRKTASSARQGVLVHSRGFGLNRWFITCHNEVKTMCFTPSLSCRWSPSEVLVIWQLHQRHLPCVHTILQFEWKPTYLGLYPDAWWAITLQKLQDPPNLAWNPLLQCSTRSTVNMCRKKDNQIPKIHSQMHATLAQSSWKSK
jgi:hypothetical protein